ncbi:hypothetical protein JW721_02065 [Candidatus Micrarchaeota archaeon]|nr:hypothetical protein [Candidatus Micrarchaeota archaeon]
MRKQVNSPRGGNAPQEKRKSPVMCGPHMGGAEISKAVGLAASRSPRKRAAAVRMLAQDEDALSYVAAHSFYADTRKEALGRLLKLPRIVFPLKYIAMHSPHEDSAISAVEKLSREDGALQGIAVLSQNKEARMLAVQKLSWSEECLKFVALHTAHADSGIRALRSLQWNAEALKLAETDSSHPEVRAAASAILRKDTGVLLRILENEGSSDAPPPAGGMHSCRADEDFIKGLREILENGG